MIHRYYNTNVQQITTRHIHSISWSSCTHANFFHIQRKKQQQHREVSLARLPFSAQFNWNDWQTYYNIKINCSFNIYKRSNRHRWVVTNYQWFNDKVKLILQRIFFQPQSSRRYIEKPISSSQFGLVFVRRDFLHNQQTFFLKKINAFFSCDFHSRFGCLFSIEQQQKNNWIGKNKIINKFETCLHLQC